MSGDDLDALGALRDPVRRALYDYVAGRDHEVGRDEAAGGAGVGRTLAAFHLDKLVEAGLLDAGFRRLTGRTGPGSGRPAKVYRRSRREHQVSVPPRDYRTLALVLAEAVEELGGEEAAEAAARRAGERAKAPGLREALRERGYEPYDDDGGAIRLRNCPFHVIAEDRPVLVCAMNLALCEGLVAAVGEEDLAPRLDARPGECCVAFSKNKPD
ncbi:ArsR family transcriptional regulator [Sphaerisporangium krabiense]|uniref:Putative ArsR family transcriptional regulator n=1 Tax=Sphaerisporangium krabiense TaxID=763782 RepID=A0A7W9DTS0_9ACTN|nr:transcriptional regulator [Sphaerisporangium krabiense]MBB5631162.1 putative ArsR family transcriptional regulator [Sphaerisporangium krabiense]GII61226.1 ArsR family transcriptional regulator [Sphaerisporangium krabiense]